MKRTLVCLILTTISANANWLNVSQEWGDIPESAKSWFRDQHSPKGVLCCNVADGHPTEYEIRGNHFWVPIAGVMREVPDEAVIHNVKNPLGRAVVWYVKQGGDTYYIRCFVKDADV